MKLVKIKSYQNGFGGTPIYSDLYVNPEHVQTVKQAHGTTHTEIQLASGMIYISEENIRDILLYLELNT